MRAERRPRRRWPRIVAGVVVLLVAVAALRVGNSLALRWQADRDANDGHAAATQAQGRWEAAVRPALTGALGAPLVDHDLVYCFTEQHKGHNAGQSCWFEHVEMYAVAELDQAIAAIEGVPGYTGLLGSTWTEQEVPRANFPDVHDPEVSEGYVDCPDIIDGARGHVDGGSSFGLDVDARLVTNGQWDDLPHYCLYEPDVADAELDLAFAYSAQPDWSAGTGPGLMITSRFFISGSSLGCSPFDLVTFMVCDPPPWSEARLPESVRQG